MKFSHIEEPLMEFGKDVHICPRAGISFYEVYDSRFSVRRSEIFIGTVSPSDIGYLFFEWINKCTQFIPAKEKSKQPNLFTSFCGFNESVGFKVKPIVAEEITRKINLTELKRVLSIKDRKERISEAVSLYYDEIKFLCQNRIVDVVVCVIPKSFDNKIFIDYQQELEETTEDREIEDENLEFDFRRALKAKAMHLGKPIQLIKEDSLKPNAKKQDDATKAWNFCTALYYKANGTVPWRLIRNPNRTSTCFVGISFYKSRDKKTIQTSLAQIFDELGHGVILRGTPVEISKEDRQPHLSTRQAHDLLVQALGEYKAALENFPARLVIHKSSNFNHAELEGFRGAVEELHISKVDFVTVMDSTIRAFRSGQYPALRGTHLTLDDKVNLLYTRGSVEYYKTYPGIYIPTPLEVRVLESDESQDLICEEILGLTKMNWNNTQFDGKYPITIACARRVGQIMKYIDPSEKPQIRYSFYM